MFRWTQVGQWHVQLELEPLGYGVWNWSFVVVDGPHGKNEGPPAASEALAFQQARAAAALAIGNERGPDSSMTRFGSTL